MRASRAILFGAIALSAAGCYGDVNKATTAPTLQVAYTRFVNAVNDTGALDFRFVDEIQNSPIGLALPYRGYTFYQATDPTFQGKPRVLRAFFDSVNTVQAITTQTVQVGGDESLTLTAGNYYTIILLGPARGSGPKWLVVQDNATAFDTTWKAIVTDTTNIAARIVNLTAADGTGESVSLFTAKDTTFTPSTAFPSLAATAPLTASGALAYTKIAVGATPAAPGQIFDTLAVRFAQVTGTPAAPSPNTWAKAGSFYGAVPFGAPASKIDDLTAIGGLIQGGTVVSAYVFAPVTIGSFAPCAGTISSGAASGCTKTSTNAMRNYAVVFIVDHNPSPSF